MFFFLKSSRPAVAADEGSQKLPRKVFPNVEDVGRVSGLDLSGYNFDKRGYSSHGDYVSFIDCDLTGSKWTSPLGRLVVTGANLTEVNWIVHPGYGFKMFYDEDTVFPDGFVPSSPHRLMPKLPVRDVESVHAWKLAEHEKNTAGCSGVVLGLDVAAFLTTFATILSGLTVVMFLLV